MALTKKQHAAREGKVTASFVPALMVGDSEKILSEWRRLIGDPSWRPEDLSHSWPAQFGSYVERFALDWHERRTNFPLSRRGESVTHPTIKYLSCTLDAYRATDANVIDCKVIGGYRKIDDVLTYYTPQMIVQRACVGAERAALLIVHGGAEPAEYPVPIEDDFESKVFYRIAKFWECVETLTPPVAMDPMIAPVPAIKEYNFEHSNEWRHAAVDWLEQRANAKLFEGAVKTIKSIMPADGLRAFGGGIVVKRNRAGSLTITEDKGDKR